MKLIKLLLVSTFVFFASSWALAQEGSGQDYAVLLDKFVVNGPGASVPGWFDDFDDGDLGDWVCSFGTCQDEPGTSFARLESPGDVESFPVISATLRLERSDLASRRIWPSYVIPDDWFQGVAIFAAELPKTNESISLQLNSKRDDNGTMLKEITVVEIYNPSDEIALRYDGVFPGGLRVAQYRGVHDEDWNLLYWSNFEVELLTAPEVLGNVILSLRFEEDGPEGPVFHAGYSLTDDAEVLEPFTPIPSNMHTIDEPGRWGIRAHVTFVQASSLTIDIKPGSDPNCFNINSHGVIPVAILGSDTFDVSNIDQSTLSFGGLEVRIRGNKWPSCGLEDTNGDGLFDLVCQFQDNTDYWSGGDSEATLTGELLDGHAL